MGLTENQQAEIAYKKISGRASTNADRTVYEEPLASALVTTPDNLWIDADLIPASAPPLTTNLQSYDILLPTGETLPLIRYYLNLSLSAVPGSANAFYHANLKDSIPFNFRSDGSFMYTLSDNAGHTLPFGLNTWIVDNQAGVLTFFEGTPVGITLPLRITFFRYVGRKSVSSIIRTDGTTQMAGAYVPAQPQDVVTKVYVDQAVEILDRLRPQAPANLSAVTLGITGSYAAYEQESGTLHPICTSNRRPSLVPSAPFLDGDTGILSVTIDSVAAGSKALTDSGDEGTYSALQILQDVDPYAGEVGKAGFYKQLVANIVPTNDLSIAGHSIVMTHSITGSSSLNFYVDNPGTPTVENISTTPPVTTTRYVSGVPSAAVGNLVHLHFQIDGAVLSHYGQYGAIMTTACFNTPTFPVTTPPRIYDTIIFDTDLIVQAGVYSETSSVVLRGLNSAQIAGVSRTHNSGVRIDTASDETIRLASGTGTYPTSYGTVFDSQQLLTASEELQQRGGSYIWPTGNYTTNLPVAGPDYSAISTPSYRWATFRPITLDNANGFVVTAGGAVNWSTAEDRSTPGVQIQARVVQTNGTPVTGWIDCNKPYPGVGIPGNNATVHGDAAMVAGSSDTTATAKRVTFGPVVRSGYLYIRIGFPSGSNKSFSTITVVAN